MKHFKSEITELGNVAFPSFKNEKIYMLPFFKNKPLPQKLKRWQSTINAILSDINCDTEMFLMIDQSDIKSGSTHRRKGKHIDGYWSKDIQAHVGVRKTGYWQNEGEWINSNFKKNEAILLASDEYGCDALIGEWNGRVGNGGDCEGINTDGLSRIKLNKNKAYIGNVTMIHESITIDVDCKRSMVRINIPNYKH